VCVWAIGKSDVVALAWPFGYLSAQQIQASAQQKALEASACWKDFFFLPVISGLISAKGHYEYSAPSTFFTFFEKPF